MIRTTAPGYQTITTQRCRLTTETGLKVTNVYYYGSSLTYQRKMGLESSLLSSSGKDSRFRPVTNTKKYWQVLESTGSFGAQTGFNRSIGSTSDQVRLWALEGLQAKAHAERYSDFVSKVSSTQINISNVQWVALATDAIATMSPSFAGGNSLINSLIELQDFKKLGLKLVSRFGFRRYPGLPGLRIGQGKHPFIRGRELPWREAIFGLERGDNTLRKMSKIFLSYKFGFESLYRDVKTLYETLSGFDRQFRELVRRANTPQQSYYGTDIPGTATVASIDSTEHNPGSWLGSFLSKVRSDVVVEAQKGIRYHATMRYRYPLPAALLAAGGRNKALLDSLGINGNPAIIWNGIKFSFLIDWIVNVGQFLDNINTDNIRFQVEILEFCHSAKLEKNVLLRLAPNYYDSARSPTHNFMSSIVTDRCTSTAYARKVGIPDLQAMFQSAGLSPTQWFLSGSLVGARRGHVSRL